MENHFFSGPAPVSRMSDFKKTAYGFNFDENRYREVRRYFSDDPAETIGDKVQEMIGLIIQRAGMSPGNNIFRERGMNSLFGFYNAMKYDALDALFYV